MRRLALLVLLAALIAAVPAHAAEQPHCAEPGADWQSVSPGQEGFDPARLQSAIDYGSSNLGLSVRVYRNGCRVGVDHAYAANRDAQFESWSMAKSMTSLVFGRAMRLGLISPDDPLGSLVPEADGPHGAITMRDLLTQSSGLRWNGARDYDILMPDRVRDGLTVDIAHPRGTFFEYSQSGPALVAEAVQRAVGEDFQSFAQRELFGPLGIEPGTWHWARDSAGHTQGFFGLNMSTDDFARFGELMRRGGMWQGRRLLLRRYVREAIAPSQTNGCYGWLIWVNAARPCIGPTVSSRPVHDRRYFPHLPTDTYHFEGLLGQIVTIMPSLGIEVARNGEQTVADLAGGGDSEGELYDRILAALTDGSAPTSVGDGDTVRGDTVPNPDEGFQHSFAEPAQFTQPYENPPLPPAGPARARALRLRLAHAQPSRTGGVTMRATCPARWPGRPPEHCVGTATFEGTRAVLSYDLAPGETRLLRFVLTPASLRRYRSAGHLELHCTAVNRDATAGTDATVPVALRRA